MGRTARRRFTVVGLLLALPGAVTFVTHGLRARAQQDTTPRSMNSLPIGSNGAAGKLVDMGATYHYLEAKATRVSTRFNDGSAVAERGADGDFRVRLRDLG